MSVLVKVGYKLIKVDIYSEHRHLKPKGSLTIHYHRNEQPRQGIDFSEFPSIRLQSINVLC